MSKFDLVNSKVFFRGDFIDFGDANLSVASSPVLYGLSVYTVFNVVWNDKTKKLNIFRLRDHYKRLCNSTKIMDFENFAESMSFEKFESTMLELLKINNVSENVLVRVTIFIDELVTGTRINGLKNSMSAYVYPMGEILNREGIHTCISSWTRAADNMIPSRAKVNGQYVNASLIKNEAIRNGYDEAIVLDGAGHVSEGTVANIFIVRDGVLITPDISVDILEGITRNSVLELAKSMGIDIAQRAVDRSELYIADEVFMCGSSANIVPVLSVDKRTIGDGKIGDVTAQLSEEYTKVQLAENSKFADWITIL